MALEILGSCVVDPRLLRCRGDTNPWNSGPEIRCRGSRSERPADDVGHHESTVAVEVGRSQVYPETEDAGVGSATTTRARPSGSRRIHSLSYGRYHPNASGDPVAALFGLLRATVNAASPTRPRGGGSVFDEVRDGFVRLPVKTYCPLDVPASATLPQ